MILNRDHGRAQEYLRALARELILSDWEINLTDETTGDKSHAGEVNVVYGRRVANISLADDLYTSSPEEFRHVCVHELLHCHFKPFQWNLDNVETHLGPPVYGLMFATYKDIEEMAIDAMTIIAAKHLPLPDQDD